MSVVAGLAADPDAIPCLRGGARLTAFANGSELRAWQGQEAGADGTWIGQSFDAAGDPLCPPFPLSATSACAGSQIVGAVLPGRRIVVAWTDAQAGAGWIRLRVFDLFGTAAGPELALRAAPGSSGSRPTLAVPSDDGFVLAWVGHGAAREVCVCVALFDARGVQGGSPRCLGVGGASATSEIGITSLPSGGFVVTWRDRGALTHRSAEQSFHTQIFDRSGRSLGSEFVCTFGK